MRAVLIGLASQPARFCSSARVSASRRACLIGSGMLRAAILDEALPVGTSSAVALPR